ncbi:MAG TPA: hypothetical protein VMW72_02780 [Sedimentisphaerales bacterium]|nr:hypothetical protein [Sedimentisphaerales bacterium]
MAEVEIVPGTLRSACRAVALARRSRRVGAGTVNIYGVEHLALREL